MAKLHDRLQEESKKLQQRRDELRVQLDLGKKDAADAWHGVESRWEEFEGKLRVLADESKDAAEDVGKAAELLLDEIREGLSRVGRLI
jgi:hypothetical protein